MEDLINNPSHYKAYGFESLKLIEIISKNCFNKEFNFYICNALKYIIRCNFKGNKKQDLLKAQFYLNYILKNFKENKCSFLKDFVNTLSGKDLQILRIYSTIDNEYLLKIIDFRIRAIIQSIIYFSLEFKKEYLFSALKVVDYELELLKKDKNA